MLLLYVGMKFDYGQPERGLSFEHCNFYDTLHHLGCDILYFDFMEQMKERGRAGMNQRLQEVVQAEQPDLLFSILFTDEIDQQVIRRVSEQTDTKTLNWFCDDHWRFENYSQAWAPCFNWVVTTAQSAVPKYAAINYTHAIKSQWACNHFLYQKLDIPLRHEVTFVGQPHGNRRALVDAIRRKGFKVNVWGQGWKTGRLSQDAMIQVFNQSRININFPNASVSSSGNASTKQRTLLRSVHHVLQKIMGQQPGTLDAVAYPSQIKARDFEVPGCGGFLLTGQTENLDQYYQLDQEVVCYENIDDLIGKLAYYLSHEDERRAIAEAAYRRTMHEHTYAHRFQAIFQQMGLPLLPLGEMHLPAIPVGNTVMIS